MKPRNADFILRHLRETGPRTAIMELFEKEKRPLDAVAVHNALPTISRSTIFRALKQLHEHELLVEAAISSGRIFYEKQGYKHHHHITCTTCGKIEDIFLCDQHDLIRSAEEVSAHFGRIKTHQLEFRGVCKSCERGIKKSTR